MLEQWHWTRTEMNAVCVTIQPPMACQREGWLWQGMAWQGQWKGGMEGKGLFFTRWSDWHPCKSDRFWKRGQREMVNWSMGHIHSSSEQAILLLWWRPKSVVHKTKNYHLTWEHRGEIQCFLAGFMGCRANFPPRRAAQRVKDFHLWGAHLRARSGSRGYTPWGCLQASQTHPVVQHHQQLHPTGNSKRNQQECVRHELHQHSRTENSADTFWEEKKSDF